MDVYFASRSFTYRDRSPYPNFPFEMVQATSFSYLQVSFDLKQRKDESTESRPS